MPVFLFFPFSSFFLDDKTTFQPSPISLSQRTPSHLASEQGEEEQALSLSLLLTIMRTHIRTHTHARSVYHSGLARSFRSLFLDRLFFWFAGLLSSRKQHSKDGSNNCCSRGKDAQVRPRSKASQRAPQPIVWEGTLSNT